jgi:hypothetical protein
MLLLCSYLWPADCVKPLLVISVTDTLHNLSLSLTSLTVIVLLRPFIVIVPKLNMAFAMLFGTSASIVSLIFFTLFPHIFDFMVIEAMFIVA